MDRKSNIILIGMSGAGKSTLGVLLAKALGMKFVDTDILLQDAGGALLSDILDTKGNEEFIKFEEAVVSKIKYEGYVIATGGSVVYSERSMRHLKDNGTVVYLKVSYDEIVRRIGTADGRGIVFRNSGTLRDVYEERAELYEMYADVVHESGGTMDDSVRALRARMAK